MAIITRADWGAGEHRAGRIRQPVQRLYLHHTVTPEWTGKDAARRVRDIARGRGFLDISYNWLVDVEGNQIEGRGWARAGAHTVGWNHSSHAISLIGNFDRDQPPDAMLAGAANLVREHGQGHGPRRITHGHRDVSSTACPGRHAYARIGYINVLAAAAPVDDEEFEDMQQGQSGKAVGVLQDHLRVFLSLSVAQLAADGEYGPKTAEAVAEAQNRLGFPRTATVAHGMFQAALWLAVNGFPVPVLNQIRDRTSGQNKRLQTLERMHYAPGTENRVEHVPDVGGGLP